MRELTSEHWSIGHKVASISGTEASSDLLGYKFEFEEARRMQSTTPIR
jgi:hypothetical protein